MYQIASKTICHEKAVTVATFFSCPTHHISSSVMMPRQCLDVTVILSGGGNYVVPHENKSEFHGYSLQSVLDDSYTFPRTHSLFLPTFPLVTQELLTYWSDLLCYLVFVFCSYFHGE